jgi:hypothetical protein
LARKVQPTPIEVMTPQIIGLVVVVVVPGLLVLDQRTTSSP